ncbi:MAG: OmpA family protein [Solirubrobacteraceae bacterium]
MKQINFKFIYIISFLLVISSCKTLEKTNNKQRGAGIGALLGGIAGAVIANNTGGKSEVGAIIGSVVGGVAGGLIGNKMDKQAKEIKEALPGVDVVKINDGEGLQVVLDESSDGIKFATNSSSLQPSALVNIKKLATIFSTNADTNLTIIGHTDDVGEDNYNLQLSLRRATSVVNNLTSNGVSASRLTKKGLGETQPKAPNINAENRALNRRVEIFITPNEKLINEAKGNN